MTRQEHLDWSKQRALEYANRGDIRQAIASMGSDLGKHDELKNHVGIQMGFMLLMSGNLKTVGEARKFIEGFN